MKLIKPSVKILEQTINSFQRLDDIFRQIEIAGRTCYKSEDKITKDSAEKFVEMIKKNGHTAMLEHGTVYLDIPDVLDLLGIVRQYRENKYSKVSKKGNSHYITTNYRVLYENNWLDDLQYLCEPTEYHEKRVSVRFICDRGVSHELVRHRVFSFVQESTRYCNYSKDKFGKEITYILPLWLKDDFEDGSIDHEKIIGMKLHKDAQYFLIGLRDSEITYFDLIEQGWQPQQARSILPNALKTEVVMTGFVSDWKHFFELRCNKTAHPQMQELAIPLRQMFIDRNFI